MQICQKILPLILFLTIIIIACTHAAMTYHLIALPEEINNIDFSEILNEFLSGVMTNSGLVTNKIVINIAFLFFINIMILNILDMYLQIFFL